MSAQPSSECIATYNATFTNTKAKARSCAVKSYAMLINNVTNEQTMMVCNAGQ